MIEALAFAGEVLSVPELYRLAVKIFQLHPFDENIGLWRIVNVDGSWSTFDMTFNHQLWFAAAGLSLKLERAEHVQRKVTKFLEISQTHHFRSSRHGLIFHNIVLPRENNSTVRLLYLLAYLLKRYLNNGRDVQREIGYQAFNLYGFSIIKKAVPEARIWSSRSFLKAMDFVSQDQYPLQLENNRFGYGYNPAGFEIAHTQQVFSEVDAEVGRGVSWWVSQQLSRTYNPNAYLMNLNTEDPATLSARFYEAIRLRDIEIQMP